jgi:outer membrane receptor for ferrienterochelin and colicins
MGTLSKVVSAQSLTDSAIIDTIGMHEKIEELVVSTVIKPISRASGPVPIEIFPTNFFKKNPSPSLLDAIGMVNGVRPQLNCNVCNTGDIHINGMEGPYTLVLIDGMPIVSALSTVYGLSGIPMGMIEKVEVIKGPASANYPGEAMGGIINVITKKAQQTPLLSVDVMTTSWQEHLVDLGLKFQPKKHLSNITGINYFNNRKTFDKNQDGFTDIALQHRISVFNKTAIERMDNRLASLALRYVYEDRWGGQMKFRPSMRGSDEIYGEHILTDRWEAIAQYQLPIQEYLVAQLSYNRHAQDSWYGTTQYKGLQHIAFAQLNWNKQLGKHTLQSGLSYRYTYYDDNTPATASLEGSNNGHHSQLPGAFLQDEWRLGNHTLLPGYRIDYHNAHGLIHTPRLSYQWKITDAHNLRFNAGKGFRVVNIFTEDHAALTGSRSVIVAEQLKPEQSWNAHIVHSWQIALGNNFVTIDATGFYSHFTNKIIPDYESNQNQIIYRNLRGNAVSRGLAINAVATLSLPIQIIAGATFMDVFQKEETPQGSVIKAPQLFAPTWTGTFTITGYLPAKFILDLSGQFNGSMHLPVQENDYRPDQSPAFCLANVQLSKKLGSKWEIYCGIKNIFDFVPKDTYMRPFDPFDKQVNDPVSNPHGYTFDTEYNYAPLQGRRSFLGLRFQLL